MQASTGDAAAAGAGLLSFVLGTIFKVVPVESIVQAFVLGAVGSLGGYLAKKGLELSIKYIKSRFKK